MGVKGFGLFKLVEMRVGEQLPRFLSIAYILLLILMRKFPKIRGTLFWGP